jgi:hypothetical protein
MDRQCSMRCSVIDFDVRERSRMRKQRGEQSNDRRQGTHSGHDGLRRRQSLADTNATAGAPGYPAIGRASMSRVFVRRRPPGPRASRQIENKLVKARTLGATFQGAADGLAPLVPLGGERRAFCGASLALGRRPRYVPPSLTGS